MSKNNLFDAGCLDMTCLHVTTCRRLGWPARLLARCWSRSPPVSVTAHLGLATKTEHRHRAPAPPRARGVALRAARSVDTARDARTCRHQPTLCARVSPPPGAGRLKNTGHEEAIQFMKTLFQFILWNVKSSLSLQSFTSHNAMFSINCYNLVL